jgi:mRNA-degrading endonuclease YafQ of YafQ-DinJ toxin-antitoxin module
VGRVFESGLTLTQLVDRLQAALGAPLPANLLDHLQAAWNNFGRLHIYEDLALIELADDYALPELLAATSLSQILIYTFSPRLVAVKSAGVDDFLTELRAKGYTPRLEGGDRG